MEVEEKGRPQHLTIRLCTSWQNAEDTGQWAQLKRHPKVIETLAARGARMKAVFGLLPQHVTCSSPTNL
eukprot:444495-Pyramimonas_sp.AAC.1